MKYPRLNELAQGRLVTEEFRGYNRNYRAGDGEWFHTENVSAHQYPLLVPRKPRGVVAELNDPQGLIAKDALAWVDGSRLFYNGKEVDGVTLSELPEMQPKRLVSMGAYLIIFPDKVCINTQDLSDIQYLEASYTSEEGTPVTYTLCKVDGTEYGQPVISATAPKEPKDGSLWIDTSESVHTLHQYSESAAMWIGVASTYIKISAPNIGKMFQQWDGVSLSGCEVNALNDTTSIIYQKSDDSIVVVGILDATQTQTDPLCVRRQVPELDFVTECNNRLWGVKYGIVNGKTVNEIYASALGDPKVWNRFLGISTDSYVASVGSDGAWTGCIAHLGSVLCFKENHIHRVSGNLPSNFSVSETICRGVQRGSEASLVIVNEILYYKSRMDVCAFDGSLPVSVSSKLGDTHYSEAVAGSIGNRYYISMKERGGAWHLFCYDTASGIWCREDSTHAIAFASKDSELYWIDAEKKALICAGATEGTPEKAVEWSCDSAIFGYSYPDNKYLSRFVFRAYLAKGASLQVSLQYDDCGEWEYQSGVSGNGIVRTFIIPVIPKRCDHLQIRLKGYGDCRVYSFMRYLEEGSDAYA